MNIYIENKCLHMKKKREKERKKAETRRFRLSSVGPAIVSVQPSPPPLVAAKLREMVKETLTRGKIWHLRESRVSLPEHRGLCTLCRYAL